MRAERGEGKGGPPRLKRRRFSGRQSESSWLSLFGPLCLLTHEIKMTTITVNDSVRTAYNAVRADADPTNWYTFSPRPGLLSAPGALAAWFY